MVIDFVFETQYGNYCDALIFPDDQPLPSDADIEAMKQERLDKWITMLTTAPDVDHVAVLPGA
jgi:hypothetical protein